jgi:uncharacterized protein (TIRG00374 family)
MAIPKSFRRKLILPIALGAVAFLILALLPDREEIAEALRTFSWKWMPIALALALANYLIRAVRWHWYLKVVGIEMPAKESLPIFLIGLMLSVTPGKAGELFKAYLVKQARGYPMSRTASVVIVERLTDMTGMLILATLGLLAVRVQGELVVALWAVMGVGILIVSSKKIMHSLLALGGRWFSEKMARRFEHAYDSLSTLMAPRCLLGGTLLSAIAWFAECISLLVIVIGFGNALGWIEATFIYCLSTLAGAALFFMPGGIGGTEAAMVKLLLEIAHTDQGVASLATILTRASTLWFAVAIGLAALFFCPLEVSEDVDEVIEHERASL